jgi:RHS repeat-associated protein
MLQPGRQYNNPTAADTSYRYGFNGKDKSNEVNGTGVDYDYGARIYDSRLGRFLSKDPLSDDFPAWSPYVFAMNNPIRFTDDGGLGVGDPMHHDFLTTVALDIYDASKAQGASTLGALLVISQAEIESTWGKDAISSGDYNLFGTMTAGNDYKRTTSQGKLKDFSNSGKYAGSLQYYFKRNETKWPNFMTLIKKDNFTSDDIDQAFNTGADYPTADQLMKGTYAYNSDMDAAGNNHYGTALFKQIATTKRRLIASLDYQIAANTKTIADINTKLATGKLSKEDTDKLTNEKNQLTSNNTRYTTVENDIKAMDQTSSTTSTTGTTTSTTGTTGATTSKTTTTSTTGH